MKYFDIKMRAKNDENQLTCYYLTSVKNDAELMSKKLRCIEKGQSLKDYYDETEELTVQQAIDKAEEHFKSIITRNYKEDHLGLNDRPLIESVDLLKRDLTDDEMFAALLENNLRMVTIRTIMKKYDISKISAERFFNIVDELNNSKNEEESNKILAKLKIKKRG